MALKDRPATKGQGSSHREAHKAARDNPDKLPKDQEVSHGNRDLISAIVVPAHSCSARLPNKPMLSATGTALVVHTLESALKCQYATDVGMVTDSLDTFRIVEGCLRGKILPIFSHCKAACGTERIASWMDKQEGWETYQVVMNLQCDEPCIDPRDLGNLMLAAHLTGEISTLVAPLKTEEFRNPNSVKAYLRGDGIRQFSRSMIAGADPSTARLHIGAYAFPEPAFRCFRMQMHPSAKEVSLEQLTWLNNGYKIRAVQVKFTDNPLSVNTPQDYSRFCERMRAR